MRRASSRARRSDAAASSSRPRPCWTRPITRNAVVSARRSISSRAIRRASAACASASGSRPAYDSARASSTSSWPRVPSCRSAREAMPSLSAAIASVMRSVELRFQPRSSQSGRTSWPRSSGAANAASSRSSAAWYSPRVRRTDARPRHARTSARTVRASS